MNRISLILLLFLGHSALGQQLDTTFLTEKNYLVQALKYAPLIRNADLNVALQDQKRFETRAAFEPVIGGKLSSKEFESTNYYNNSNAHLKVRTPIGVNISGGYQNNSGAFLNPENNVPTGGLAYAGIEVPLGAGLITDKARANLKVETLSLDAAHYIQVIEVNNYLLDAGISYWKWYESLMLIELSNEAVQLASNRYDLVRRKHEIGEVAAIDTLESFINYQNRQAFNIESQTKWIQSGQKLGNFIWDSTMMKNVLAAADSREYMADLPNLDGGRATLKYHPIIRLIELDSLINQVNLALSRELQKPTLNLEMRLQERPENMTSFNYQPSQNNYIGMTLYAPILMRKSRAKAAQAKIKQEVLVNKKGDMLNKLNNLQMEYLQVGRVSLANARLWESASQNYRKLRDAEQGKFLIGESSVFLLNSRELKWIESRQKYIKAYVEYRIQILRYYHSLGILTDQFAEL